MELAALLEISGVRKSFSETIKSSSAMDRGSSSKTSTGTVKAQGAALGKSDGNFWSDILRTQRKIPHLLQTEGTLQVHLPIIQNEGMWHNAHVTIPSETCFPDFSIFTTLSGRW